MPQRLFCSHYGGNRCAIQFTAQCQGRLRPNRLSLFTLNVPFTQLGIGKVNLCTNHTITGWRLASLPTFLLQGMLAIVRAPIPLSSDATWTFLAIVCRERMDWNIEQAERLEKNTHYLSPTDSLKALYSQKGACPREAVVTVSRIQMDQTTCFRRTCNSRSSWYHSVPLLESLLFIAT